MRNPWNVYLGDCAIVDSYLRTRPVCNLRWFPLHFINIFLRSVGQPCFVNNPLCAFFILLAIFMLNWEVGLGCVLGGSVATITELLLGLHPWDMVMNGAAPLNGVLVGTVISIVFPGMNGGERTAQMWIAIVIGSVASVFFASAFLNFLGKVNVPYMALPFNIIALCIFLTLKPAPEPISIVARTFNASDPYCGDGRISWCGVGRGILVSMGQVYACNSIVSSMLMNLGVLLSSPLLFTMNTIGATIGCLMAISILPEEDYYQIYDGVWGYNALLAMSSVACVFFPFSPVSFVAGLVNTLATVCIQAALRITMDKDQLPVLTVPMTLCTIVILMASQSRPSSCGTSLIRVQEMSYPEKQAIEAWRQAKRRAFSQESTPETKRNVFLQDSSPEELEPALEKILDKI